MLRIFKFMPFLILGANVISSAFADETTNKIILQFPQPLPADVVTEIKNANSTDIFPIGKNEKFDGKIIKADTVTFSPGSVLQFTNAKQKWVAIVAKTIQFADSGLTSTIRFSQSIPSNQLTALAPLTAPPQNGRGECNSVAPLGTSGQNGLNGIPGEPGATVPTLYLIADKINVQSGSAKKIKLKIIALGGNGGDGQNGQDGQPGGAGGLGGRGVWTVSWVYPTGACTCPAGAGGYGGYGGIGGQGGAGGVGADGGIIMYGGTTESLGMLTSFTVLENQGGNGGKPGQAGANAIGGIQGERGFRPGFCGGGDDSKSETPRSRFVYQPLSPAENGNQGIVDVVNTTAAALFEPVVNPSILKNENALRP